MLRVRATHSPRRTGRCRGGGDCACSTQARRRPRPAMRTERRRAPARWQAPGGTVVVPGGDSMGVAAVVVRYGGA
ncbi:hypothetical protein SCATT_35320 [Streptantibioticus cattleyicolor NRRL 8057 = DSM 46488]|uniref:Uncharacterized protein n=1 Tax=Streptantibioticus cattleyicolor (strain ATCC 35852 / DSM 46488 / JCM 4925 / NBRC 14057 / NRRL 8057) TaxID=1003195 RepID=G8WUL4_STREN|nr:hypothetical protein SCATT_35320 [Streptantibioticus cattleyicolor NRRL 8057 = DSM 46488]